MVDAGGDQKAVDIVRILSSVLRRDARGDGEREITNRLAEGGDLVEVGGLAGGNARGAHRVHETGGQPRGIGIVLGRHFALLLEAGTARVESPPAAGVLDRCDLLGLDLAVNVTQLVNPGVIGPVAVDGRSLALEICRNTMINGAVIRIDGAIRMQPK